MIIKQRMVSKGKCIWLCECRETRLSTQKTHGIGIKDETGLVGKGRVKGVGKAQEDDECCPLDPSRRRGVLRVRGEGEEGEEDDEEELQLLAERSAHGCFFGVCVVPFLSEATSWRKWF